MKARTIDISILSIEHPYERVLRGALIGLVVVLAVLYVYFVWASIVHIIARKDMHMQMTQLQGSVAELESRAYLLSGEVSESRAASIGLVPVEEKAYVTRATRLGHAGSAAGGVR